MAVELCCRFTGEAGDVAMPLQPERSNSPLASATSGRGMRYHSWSVRRGEKRTKVLVDEIRSVAKGILAELKEKKGVYTLEFTVAERKVFLSKKKLTYSAKFRIDDVNKELRFTEMLKEASSGMSSGDGESGPGFGFKKETFKTGSGSREGVIEQQSELFGKQYTYTFDFKTVRSSIAAAATAAGYAFKYQITPVGL
jgi:hypothetical protein